MIHIFPFTRNDERCYILFHFLKTWEMLHKIPSTWKLGDAIYNSIYLKTWEMLPIIPFIWKQEKCYM